MAIADIVEKILSAARQEADKNMQEAQTEYDRRLSNAEAELKERRDKWVERAEAEYNRERERQLQIVDLDYRKTVLSVKKKAIQDSFDEALEKVLQYDDRKYLELIRELILRSAETGTEEIITNEKDKGRISKSFVEEVNDSLKKKGLKGELKLSGETRDIVGGVVLRMGKVEMNADLRKIFDRQGEDLEPEVNKILFG